MVSKIEIIKNLLTVKDKNGYEMFKLLLQSMSDMDIGKLLNELRHCVELSESNQDELKVSASDFKKKILKRLADYYAYGDEYGYSNAELSRIRSCIIKVEETPINPAEQKTK